MTIIAITLITIGIADLLRRGHRVPAFTVAFLLPLLLAWLVGIETTRDWLVLYIGVATAMGWLLSSHRASEHGFRADLPLGILGGGLALLALYGTQSPIGGSLGGWLESNSLPGMRALGPELLLLFIGAALVQLSTGNIIVRLVLEHIGALRPEGQSQPADKLRGGRLLGPMERIFILGLGLAGQVTAAGLVIAAKGLIRFPELQAQARADAVDAADTADVDGVDGIDDAGRASRPRRAGTWGIDELTEYFLIGSFVSWLVALTTLALVWFGGWTPPLLDSSL